MARNLFKSRIGLIAATVCSAIGLGNVWRFPAETQANGGAAFLLLYIVCVLVLGIPVMLAEFSLGRGGRSDVIGVFRRLAPRTPWWLTGVAAVLASYLIISFYMVVAGWTLEYLWESLTGGLYQDLAEGTDTMRQHFAARMEEYICTDNRPLLFTMAMILINIGVLAAGVQKGIERLSNVMMPMLFVILLVLLAVSLSLPHAADGVVFFLAPDFSSITPAVVVSALGQALFSLSLGAGTIVTYASYYPDSTKLGRTSVIVASLSVLVAVLMGLIIFPAVTSFGITDASFGGSTLVFVTLPEVFANMPATGLWSSLFFLLLLVAALTSTVSIAEVPVAMLSDRLGMRRLPAVLAVMLPLLVLSTLCSLSFGSLADAKILGMTVFELFDATTTNVLMPAVALAECLFLGWFAPRHLLNAQLTNDGTLRAAYAPAVAAAIRYLAPALIIAIATANYL